VDLVLAELAEDAAPRLFDGGLYLAERLCVISNRVASGCVAMLCCLRVLFEVRRFQTARRY